LAQVRALQQWQRVWMSPVTLTRNAQETLFPARSDITNTTLVTPTGNNSPEASPTFGTRFDAMTPSALSNAVGAANVRTVPLRVGVTFSDTLGGHDVMVGETKSSTVICTERVTSQPTTRSCPGAYRELTDSGVSSPVSKRVDHWRNTHGHKRATPVCGPRVDKSDVRAIDRVKSERFLPRGDGSARRLSEVSRGVHRKGQRASDIRTIDVDNGDGKDTRHSNVAGDVRNRVADGRVAHAEILVWTQPSGNCG
jgi:hypothetical protein